MELEDCERICYDAETCHHVSRTPQVDTTPGLPPSLYMPLCYNANTSVVQVVFQALVK
jgi:hypothetical protein